MKNLKRILLPITSAATLCLAFPTFASPALDMAKQLNQAFIEVADKASQSVVVIDVTERRQADMGLEDGSLWEMLPPGLRKHFREQYEMPAPEETRGQGSGVIIREDGYILTNRHVVEDADKIEVRLKDGRRFKAEVRGTDPQSDVAVLKIDAHHLPAAKLGDSSQTRVGEFAIAIGAPFSLEYSVTFGHVSAKGRSGVIYDPLMDQEFIQTDANINPGNSGGPLVNINGEVIGINTLIRGLRTGIGFAIPINLAKEVADKLITDGKYTRAWLGIGIRALHDAPELQPMFPSDADGVVVQTIEPNGPAAKSQLRPADLVTGVDGMPVKTAQQLKNEIRRKQLGQTVTLDVVRYGKPMKIQVKAGALGDDKAMTAQPAKGKAENAPAIGLKVQALTPVLAEEFNTEMTPAVIVVGVERGSLADRRGVQIGDIITGVNDQTVASPADLHAALKKADLKKGVILQLISGQTRRFLVLQDGED